MKECNMMAQLEDSQDWGHNSFGRRKVILHCLWSSLRSEGIKLRRGKFKLKNPEKPCDSATVCWGKGEGPSLNTSQKGQDQELENIL